MEKTIKIDSKTTLKVSNNISWMMAYNEQFNRDVLETLQPAVVAAVDVFAAVAEVAKEQGVNTADVLRTMDAETLRDAVIDLAGLGAVDIINIIWSMAKAADEDIEEPSLWVKQFNVFPLDVILPAVVSLAFQGLITTKKLKGIQEWTRALDPSPSIES
jgi:hypothetical protein